MTKIIKYGIIYIDKENNTKKIMGGNKMTKQTIKEIKLLLKGLDSNIENYVNDSFRYWKASKLIYENLVNVYVYNAEKKDLEYILYQKEAFKIFNDNLHYLFLAIQQKNIKIKNFMLAYSSLLENFIHLKSFLNDLQGEYITTTPKKIKQFEHVLTYTNAFLAIVEKHIELLEESAKKL